MEITKNTKNQILGILLLLLEILEVVFLIGGPNKEISYQLSNNMVVLICL